jgi:iron transport multicopper oxidase
VDDFDATLDDYTLVPFDKQEIYDHVDHQILLNFKMDNLGDGAN